MSSPKVFVSLAISILLAACGGGGGSSGTSTNAVSASNPLTTSISGTGSATAVVPAGSPLLTVSVVNQSGAVVNSVSVGGGFIARATLLDTAGAAVAAKLVTFSLNGATIAVVSPTTALTNALGVAEVVVAPASISSVGAASLAATADVANAAVTGKVDFSVAATSLTLSTIGVGSINLSSGGNTSLQTTALVGGKPSTGVPVNVTYSSSCGRINGSVSAGGVSVTTDGSGVASAVYTAVAPDGSLCSGPVTISASSAGAAPQSTSVNVAAATANAVTFISAAPAQIFVAGSGAVDQSIVRFRVLSSAGTAMSNVAVQFAITTNPGGVGLNTTGSVTPVLATTDASGEASVSVFSGTIPGPVKVRAALVSDPTVFSESQNLTVASGPPSQRFMSVSVQTFNIEGWILDGSSTQITVRLADRQGNAVADGTVVNFTAEGGQVASNCATARVNGISQCSVNFISQNPKPAGPVGGGRVSVLAYTEGTKDYIDVNGNNRYDPGIDTLVAIGDAYRDDNENGIYNTATGEFLIPRGGSSICAGVGEPFPSRVDTCDLSLKTTVRQQVVILFSSSGPVMELVGAVSTSGFAFLLRSKDNLLLPMPAGTIVSATANDTNSKDGLTCVLARGPASPIPNVDPTNNPLSDLATPHGVSLKDCVPGDSVDIDVTVPSGLKTSFNIKL
jgi:hypothetical protein